jgi:hypothetical protein
MEGGQLELDLQESFKLAGEGLNREKPLSE